MKYYEVEINDLCFGFLRKQFKTYKEAREYYFAINTKLAKTPCKIIMKSIEKHEQTGEVIEVIQHIDTPGKSISLEYKLEQLKSLVDEISNLKNEFEEVEQVDNDLFFNLRHAIEMGFGTNLTGEESKRILDNLHLESIVRRGAKKELKKINYCRQSLSNLTTNINKAISDLNKFNNDQLVLSKGKTVQLANKKYEDTLTDLVAVNY